ncbi:hypothetical protein KA005_64920 [bacterium]|nr:hypothetical protein [bacterium]
MATLSSLTAAIHSVVQDDSYIDGYADRINDAVNNIAGGIRMPDGTTSPPLPELMASDTISTTTDAYADLPTNYQRGLFYVVDSSGDRLLPPDGGNYYSFMLFLNHCYKRDLTETGSVTKVCVRGKKFYYQGIPTDSEDLLAMYYRAPVAMASTDDEPDGIPGHLQTRLLKHYVCKEIFGEGLEDGAEAHGTGTNYHTSKFYEAMIDLVDFIGVDAEPEYYASSDNQCDCQIGY